MAAPRRWPPLKREPLGLPIGYQFGCPGAKAVTQPYPRPCSALLTCIGFRPDKDLKLLQDAELQALRDHFRRSEHAFDLRKRGAKGTRTPGLLHAMQLKRLPGL